MAGAEKPAPRQRTIFLLGVRVDTLDFGAALGMVEGFAAHRDSFPPRTVFFASAGTICAARRDAGLRDRISRADLVLPSGDGVAIGAKILGTPLRESLKSAELLSALLEHAQRSGMSVYLLGEAPERAGDFRAHVFMSYPRLRIVGASGDGERAEKEINACNPDLVLVALGTPAGEEWIFRNAKRLSAGVCIATGGEIDPLRGPPDSKPAGRTRIERVLRSLRPMVYGGIRPLLDAAHFFTLVLARVIVPRRLRLIYRRTTALREH